jgi:hypothetical protein
MRGDALSPRIPSKNPVKPFHHALQVPHHFSVAKTHHPKPLRFEPSCAPLVVLESLWCVMLVAVHFDHEFVGEDEEIEDVVSEWALSAHPEGLMAQVLEPEFAFGWGGFAAHLFGFGDVFAVVQVVHLFDCARGRCVWLVECRICALLFRRSSRVSFWHEFGVFVLGR